MRNKKKRRKRRAGLYLALTVALLLVGVLGIKKYTIDANCQRLQEQQKELEDRIASLEEERKEIDERAAYMQTPKYIEDMAREKLGLVYKNEVIFKAEK